MVGIMIIFVIIFVQEGQRRIPIQYANRVRGHRIYQGLPFLPLRVNMSASSRSSSHQHLLFPLQIATYFKSSSVGVVSRSRPDPLLARPRGLLYLSSTSC